MGLPVIQHPIFELKRPSTGESIKYRPFLVKEEKILLIAQQAADPNSYITAINQVLTNCMIDCTPTEWPVADTEYAFLQLRANSVKDSSKINIFDEETEDWVEVEVDLTKMELNSQFKAGLIDVSDDIKLEVRYPRYEDLLIIPDGESMMGNSEFVVSCIKKVYQGEEEFDLSDFKPKEVTEFLDQLPANAWADVSEYLVTYPRVKLDAEYTVKVGKKNVKKTRTLEGLNDFF
tara:strand:- start:11190 stop:11888 length:699 start_codon:yes stop_codon:yes gene_type:complete